MKEEGRDFLPADRLINHFVSNLRKLEIVAVTEPACDNSPNVWSGYRVELALQHEGRYITDNWRLEIRQRTGCNPVGTHVPIISVHAKVCKLRVR